MSDTDVMLTAWLRPGARSRGLLWSEYIAHHGCSDCRAHRDLGELIDLRLVERRNPKPGQGRYPKEGPHRGRPPSVYVLTDLGAALLSELERKPEPVVSR